MGVVGSGAGVVGSGVGDVGSGAGVVGDGDVGSGAGDVGVTVGDSVPGAGLVAPEVGGPVTVGEPVTLGEPGAVGDPVTVGVGDSLMEGEPDGDPLALGDPGRDGREGSGEPGNDGNVGCTVGDAVGTITLSICVRSTTVASPLSQGMGLVNWPLTMSSKWRWHPVEYPVLPTRPTPCSVSTCWPTFTPTDDRWL